MTVGPMGYAAMTQFAAPEMEKCGGGAIVNISSISAHIAQPGRWTYNAAKGAVAQLMRRCGFPEKVDAHGNFWAGSMDDNLQSPTGILYHNDTGIGVIYAFDVDEHQNIANKREFVRLDKETDGSIDGITVDREGGIWLAHFGGGRVTRFSPDGEVLKVIGLPAPNITSCTFGGPGLDTLYITTARCLMPEDQLRQFPLAGSLFSCIPGVAGLATPKFKG